MNSTLFESVHGFLNKKSAFHSVEWRVNSEVMPPSSSSHFSIGVISTATVGPKLDTPSLVLLPAAPPKLDDGSGFGLLIGRLRGSGAAPKKREHHH